MPAFAASLLLVQAASARSAAAANFAVDDHGEACSEGSLKREALGAFLEGPPGKDVSPEWIPNMYPPVWNSDHPELGYPKQPRFRDDGSIALEIGMYPTAAAQMNSGTTKQ